MKTNHREKKFTPSQRIAWSEYVNDCLPVLNQFWKIPELKDQNGSLSKDVREHLEDMYGKKESDEELCRTALLDVTNHRKCGRWCPAAGIWPEERPYVFYLNREPLRSRIRHCKESNYQAVLGDVFGRDLKKRLAFSPESPEAKQMREKKTQELLALWKTRKERENKSTLERETKRWTKEVQKLYPFYQWQRRQQRLRDELNSIREEQTGELLQESEQERKRIQGLLLEQQEKEAENLKSRGIRAQIIDHYCRSSFARVMGMAEDTIQKMF